MWQKFLDQPRTAGEMKAGLRVEEAEEFDEI